MIISLKVPKNRFHWFQLVKACFTPVPRNRGTRTRNRNQFQNQPDNALTSRNPRNRFLASSPYRK